MTTIYNVGAKGFHDKLCCKFFCIIVVYRHNKEHNIQIDENRKQLLVWP